MSDSEDTVRRLLRQRDWLMERNTELVEERRQVAAERDQAQGEARQWQHAALHTETVLRRTERERDEARELACREGQAREKAEAARDEARETTRATAQALSIASDGARAEAERADKAQAWRDAAIRLVDENAQLVKSAMSPPRRDPLGIAFVERLKAEYASANLPLAVNALERVLIALRMRAMHSVPAAPPDAPTVLGLPVRVDPSLPPAVEFRLDPPYRTPTQAVDAIRAAASDEDARDVLLQYVRQERRGAPPDALAREGKGVVANPGTISSSTLLCISCGKLPPFNGCSALCPACNGEPTSAARAVLTACYGDPAPVPVPPAGAPAPGPDPILDLGDEGDAPTPEAP